MDTKLKAPRGSYSVSSYFVITISLALLGFIAFIAAAASSIMLATFAATAFVLMLAMRLWGRFSLARLEVELSCSDDRLFCGDRFSLGAEIHNRKALPVWMHLSLKRPEALTPVAMTEGIEGSEGIEGESGLLPFGQISGSWSFTAGRRGVFTLGPATLGASDILDLCRREKVLPFKRDIVVYPRLIALGDLDLPFRDYFGIHPSKGIIEDPAWYEGTREYSGNKPARNIHWKASARLGVLQEKIFEPTTHQKIFFLVDGEGFRRAEDNPGFESALEMTASLLARFAERGASFALATDRRVQGFPAILPLGRGPEHLGMALELLARCFIEHGQAMLPLLEGVSHQGAGFVVIARKPGETIKKFYSLPATRRDKVMFVFAEDFASGEEGAYRFTTFSALRARTEETP
ncbi:MAG TPA: hypothetical protein DIT55_07425 [Spirochaetaceae bacterium]|nr:hypothetical protein [Spirochaetaceae bacterium]